MIEQSEITSSLETFNNKYFYIPDLQGYANKIILYGKSKEVRQEKTGELISYVLYYDNYSEIFISMVWTRPDCQRKGLAQKLISELIQSADKDIWLQVNKNNPARDLYLKLGFVAAEETGELVIMWHRKRVAIMQPYTFPYIGYFQLIHASSLFVFYDDVNYIKKGWVNRNRILINNKEHLFSIPISKISQNKLINETELFIDNRWINKFYKMLLQNYRKAPFYSNAIDVVMSAFVPPFESVADLAIMSIVNVCGYLGLQFSYIKSSASSPETQGGDRADRLIAISKKLNFKSYVNMIGGEHLYDKDYFKLHGVELKFIKSGFVKYKQFNNDFIPSLSIIDVLMFNDVRTIKEFVEMYTIE